MRYLEAALVVLIVVAGASAPGFSQKQSKHMTRDRQDGAFGRTAQSDSVIAFAITPPNGNAEIFTMNADGTGKTQLTDQPGRPYGPAYSPDATEIAFYNHLSASTWSIYVMNADGTDIRRLTNQPGVLDWSPDWSPDGSQIVFARSYSSPVWRSEIWAMEAGGGDLRRLGTLDAQGPDWSPDGTKIVCFNYVDGGGDIWVMDADGSNPVSLTSSNPSEDWWPKWSPDGARIAFQSKRNGNHEIYVMDADGGNPERLTDNAADDEDPNWSSDGSMIAFISMRDGHYEIYSMNADGSDQTRLTVTSGHAIDPDWEPANPSNVPVFLAGFSAVSAGSSVTMTWSVHDAAAAEEFRLTADMDGKRREVAITSTGPRSFKAVDDDPSLRAGGTVTYILYSRGSDNGWEIVREERVELAGPRSSVDRLEVYPNPFNPHTTISFKVNYLERVKIAIQDAAGRKVKTLVDIEYPAGDYRVFWDGRNASGREVSSGVYFLELVAGRRSESRKLVLVR
jgi:Tol biopolymer transport system component